MPRKRLNFGVIDPVTIIGVLFLITTLSIGTYVVADQKYNFNILERASKWNFLPDDEFDEPLSSGSQNNTSFNWDDDYLTKDEEEFIKKTQKDSFNQLNKKIMIEEESPAQQSINSQSSAPAGGGCYIDADRTLPQETVVVYSSGTNDYRYCGSDGWTTDCDPSPTSVRTCTLADVTPGFAPVYIQPQYREAVNQRLQEQQTECSAGGEVWLGNQCGIVESRVETIDLSRFGENNATNIVMDYKDSTGQIIQTNTIRDVDITNTIIQGRGQKVAVTTIKDSDGKIISSNMTPLLTQYDQTVEKVDDGFIRDFTTILRNRDTNEILSAITKSVHTKDLAQITQPVIQNRQDCIVNPLTGQSSCTTISQKNVPIYNFTYCNKDGASASEIAECNQTMSGIYNNPIVGHYIQSFSNSNGIFRWQQLGYSSSEEAIQDCINKNGISASYGCMRKMTGYGKEQVISSVDLGTNIASVITLPVAPAVFGTKSLFMLGIGTLGGTMTVQQTKNAVIAQIENPSFFKAGEDINPNGFWKTIDPQTYLTDAGYQTTMAGLGWLNLGTADNLIRAWGPTGNAIIQQNARVVNTIVSGINLAVDTPYAVNTCTTAGLLTSDCAFAGGVLATDIIFGGLDYFQGQLTLNPIRAVTETIDSIAPIVSRNVGTDFGLRGLSGDIGGWPIDSNLPIRQIDSRISDLQNLINQNPPRIIIPSDQVASNPAWDRAQAIFNNTDISMPLAPYLPERMADQTELYILTQLENRNVQSASSMLFAPQEKPVTAQSYLADLGNKILNDVNESFSNFWQNNVYSWETGFLPRWINVDNNPIANLVFGSPQRFVGDLPTTPLTTRIGDWIIRPDEVIVNISNESPWQSINRTEAEILNDSLPIKGKVVDLPQSNPETGLSTAIIYRSPQEGRVTVYRGIGDPETIFGQTASLLRGDPNNADLRIAVKNFADDPSPETFNAIKQLIKDPEGINDIQRVEEEINRLINGGLKFDEAIANIHLHSTSGPVNPGKTSPYLSATTNIASAASDKFVFSRNGGVLVLSVPEEKIVRFNKYGASDFEVGIKTGLEPDEIIAFIPITSSTDVNPRLHPDFSNDLANASQYVDNQARAITQTNTLSPSAGVWDGVRNVGRNIREGMTEFFGALNAPREIPENSGRFTEGVSNLVNSDGVSRVTRFTNLSSPVLIVIGATVGGYQYWESYVSNETKRAVSDFWQNITSPILDLFNGQVDDKSSNVIGKGLSAIFPSLSTPSTIKEPEYKDVNTSFSNTQAQSVQQTNNQRPSGLTSTGEGICQRIDRSNPCDGERMYELYLWYKNQPDAWWNQDGDFTPADFLSLMLLAEAKGADPEFLKAITAASSSQLWGSNAEHQAYCTTPECEAGIFNFIGAYMEVGTRRYNAIIANPISNNNLKLLINSDQQNANYFAQNGVTIDQIGDMTISNPVSVIYNNDVPTHWGNFGCGADCDYLGDNWLQNAGRSDIKVNTTDRCGLYDIYGQNGVMAVVYTNNQKYNWSLPNSPCFNN